MSFKVKQDVISKLTSTAINSLIHYGLNYLMDTFSKRAFTSDGQENLPSAYKRMEKVKGNFASPYRKKEVMSLTAEEIEEMIQIKKSL